MDYVLYAYAAVMVTAGWAFCFTLGGQGTRVVLTLGAYRSSPNYRRAHPRPARGPNRLVRGHADHRARRDDFDAMTLLDLPPAAAALASGPGSPSETTVILPVVPGRSLVVHAELEQPGAEHWGGLLADMTTEEREIYNLEMYQTHEEAMDIQRDIYARSDDWFAQLMDRWNADTDAVTCGARGWDTGTWHLYDAEQRQPA